MKFILSLALLVIFQLGYAQETAPDFTVTDCNGNTFHLYEELDAGKVVILDFVMLPECQPCIDAGNAIQPLFEGYETDYPGMVLWFSISNDDLNTCDQILAWETQNGFTPTASWADLDGLTFLYGGVGMPTIAVVGGAEHLIHFQHLGFSSQAIGGINNTVLQLLEANAVGENIAKSTTIYPNPATNTISWNADLNATTVVITDLAGRCVLHESSNELDNNIQINTLPQGAYAITLISANGEYKTHELFLKQ